MSDLRDYLLVEGLPGRSREVTDGVEYKQAAFGAGLQVYGHWLRHKLSEPLD